jgi:hypothetical protein
MRARRLASCACALVLVACASSASRSNGDTDAGTPAGQPRSFRRDVVPIFAQSCATASCHGSAQNGLGIVLLVGDPPSLHAQLLRESPTATGMKLVLPGEPTKSFLYAKVVGDQGDYTCTVPGCGETMPPGTKIPSTQRDTLRDWISEGANED